MAKENQVTVKTTEPGVVITRTFQAPPALVWKAWTDPKHLMRWWGPKNFTSPSCKIDFRVGGKYLYCMRSAEGQEFWSTGTYREIILYKKIVCTDSFSDEKGNIVPASHYGMADFPMECQITITFEEYDGKTKFTLHHVGIPAGEITEMTTASWNESFDKLVAILKQTGANQ